MTIENPAIAATTTTGVAVPARTRRTWTPKSLHKAITAYCNANDLGSEIPVADLLDHLVTDMLAD